MRLTLGEWAALAVLVLSFAIAFYLGYQPS